MCTVIDDKSREVEDNGPWTSMNQLEGKIQLELLPRDFHAAVDANISDKILWDQIQNETKMRA